MSNNQDRQARIDQYRAMSRQAAESADVRRLNEWRMPSSADQFNLERFAGYLEANGDALAALAGDPLRN